MIQRLNKHKQTEGDSSGNFAIVLNFHGFLMFPFKTKDHGEMAERTLNSKTNLQQYYVTSMQPLFSDLIISEMLIQCSFGK